MEGPIDGLRKRRQAPDAVAIQGQAVVMTVVRPPSGIPGGGHFVRE